MRTFISKDMVPQAKPIVLNKIIEILKLDKIYNTNPNDINEYLDISNLLLVLDRHIFPEYRITSMSFAYNSWEVQSYAFKSYGKDLVEALWKAVNYAYDEEERRKELEEKERIWKESNEQNMVNVRHYG